MIQVKGLACTESSVRGDITTGQPTTVWYHMPTIFRRIASKTCKGRRKGKPCSIACIICLLQYDNTMNHVAISYVHPKTVYTTRSTSCTKLKKKKPASDCMCLTHIQANNLIYMGATGCSHKEGERLWCISKQQNINS